MCLPSKIPDKDHFLRLPVLWTHNVWEKIINSRGNEPEIKKYFQLFPVLDAHIEDLISLHLTQAYQYTTNANEKLQSILQDYFVTINIDKWDSTKTPQYPSVLQQMCSAAVKYRNILTTNYYYPLYSETAAVPDYIEADKTKNQISGSDTATSTPMAIDNNQNFNVDVIDLAQLDSLISQQLIQDDSTEDQLSSTPAPTQNANRHASMFVYRVVLRRLYGVKTPGTSRSEAFKSFYIAMKHEDNQAAVRPFYSGDANKLPSITASTQVQKPELIDIQRYHRGFIPNQKFSLTGEMVIESSLSFEALEIALSGWLHKNYYSMTLSECQTAELVTVGVLIHSSFTINRNELNSSLKSIIQSQPEDERFDVSIRKDDWYCSAGKIDMLFVAVDRPNINTGINFMSKMYDGMNKIVPQGNIMWFIPTYQLDITEEIREKIGQEQRAWRGSEMACFVQGFRDPSTVVKLADGTIQTIRNLIFRFPSGLQGHPRKTLFHGVDKDPVHDGWLILRYNKDDANLFRQRSSNLAYEINKLLEEGEDTKVFTNPDVGLSFGGEISKAYSARFIKGRKRNPVPVDSEVVQHFHNMVGKLQNIAIKRTPAQFLQSEATSHHSTMQNSYAAKASSSTITSTTRTSDSGVARRHDTVQTTTSVTVVEQYEQRFVRIETMCHDNATRITRVERTTGRTNDMLKVLLRHNGIAVDDDETGQEDQPHVNSTHDQMDVETLGTIQGTSGGTKRTRQSNITDELTETGSTIAQNANHA